MKVLMIASLTLARSMIESRMFVMLRASSQQHSGSRGSAAFQEEIFSGAPRYPLEKLNCSRKVAGVSGTTKVTKQSQM